MRRWFHAIAVAASLLPAACAPAPPPVPQTVVHTGMSHTVCQSATAPVGGKSSLAEICMTQSSRVRRHDVYLAKLDGVTEIMGLDDAAALGINSRLASGTMLSLRCTADAGSERVCRLDADARPVMDVRFEP